MKMAWIAALAMFAGTALAEGPEIGPNCTLKWVLDTPPPVDGVRVFWDSVKGGRDNNAEALNLTTTSCSDVGITRPGQYFVAVRAFNLSGESLTESNEVAFVLLDVPNAPRDLRVE